MSHLIMETDSCYVPQIAEFPELSQTWHGLQVPPVGGGRILADGSNIPNALCRVIEGKLNPTFDIAGDVTVTPEMAAELKLDGYKILAMVRGNKILPLHVPKDGYKVYQNGQAFSDIVAACSEVVGKDGFEIAAAITMGNGKMFSVSLLIKDHARFNIGKLANGKPDSHLQYFTLCNSHNGMLAKAIYLSMIRGICANTVNAGLAAGDDNGTVLYGKHTANSELRFNSQAMAEALKVWLDRSKAFQATLAMLKDTPMKESEFQAFVSGLFTNAKTDELSHNSFYRIEEMTPIFNGGMGNRGASRYDAFNAITQFFTHGSKDSSVTAAKRVSMANFGRGNDWKNEAFRIFGDAELYAETVKRGAILLDDKRKVMAAAN